MKIHVGSKNPTKIAGVENVVKQSEMFKDAKVVGVDASVEEFGHPKTLDDTIQGAKDRALAVHSGADYSVGLESGLFTSNDTKSGYLETTVCAIYDGNDFHIGMGPSFEWPKKMIELILDGQDGSQAFKSLGLTEHEKVGTKEGGIHVLSFGKVNRTNLNELAFAMALIQLENPDHY